MPVVRTGETEADKELQRWNTPKQLGGEGPDGYEPFPKMLYQARQLETGKVVCTEVDPRSGAMYGGTTRIVKNEHELAIATGQGWHAHPTAAVEAFERQQQGIAQAAAEEAYRVARMSDKAQAEHAAANEDTFEHVVEVPAPKRRPKRSYHRRKLVATPSDVTVT